MGGYKGLKGIAAITASGVAIAISLFSIYTSGFGLFTDLIQRGISLGLVLCLTFAMLPAKKGVVRKGGWGLFNGLLMVLSLVVCAYVVIEYETIVYQFGFPTPIQVVLGAIAVLLILEASRRTIGLALPIIAVSFMLYVLLGGFLPGEFGHRGYGFDQLIGFLYITTSGIWGLIMGTAATIVAIYIVLAAFLLESGAGKVFLDAACLVAGRTTGGAAKVAVVSSALFGTVSGSAVANVVAAGSLTIPMMKSLGYEPRLAAAVEATASTGGHIMPPVMGAAAFIMAELLGISYVTIAIAATIPAMLYFFGVFVGVHFEAARMNLRPMPKEMLPKAGDVLPKLVVIVIPLALLILFLLLGYTPGKAAFYCILACSALCFWDIKSSERLTASDRFIRGSKRILNALRAGAESLIVIIPLCACAGIVVGSLSLTGVGLKFSSLIVAVSGGFLVIALLLTVVACVVLGMGLPSTAAYIMTAVTAAPTLVALGVALLPAHMFVFYFSMLAVLTPPVCAAVFVAAGMANTAWLPVAWTAMRLGLPAYILPFAFVYNSAFFMMGGASAVIIAILCSGMGTFFMAAGLMGYFYRRAHAPERVLLSVGGVLLFFVGYVTIISGLVLVASGTVWHLVRVSRTGRNDGLAGAGHGQTNR